MTAPCRKSTNIFDDIESGLPSKEQFSRQVLVGRKNQLGDTSAIGPLTLA
jgi:hypothetical protein